MKRNYHHTTEQPAVKRFKQTTLSTPTSGKFILSDSLEALQKLDSNSIDLVITSPPYNIGKDYETSKTLSTYLEYQEKLIAEMYRVVKNTGSVCWQVGNYVTSSSIVPLDIKFLQLFVKKQFTFQDRFYWTYNFGMHLQNRFSGRYETILWFTKSMQKQSISIPTLNNPTLQSLLEKEVQSKIWDIPNVKGSHPEKTEHPCQFPVELVERILLLFSKSGDVVVDPFSGSGTTAIACEKWKRNYIMIDYTKEYVQLAEERVALYKSGELSIRPIGKPIMDGSKDKRSKVPKEWENQ